jgi:LacI family transcriptional regulator
VNVVPAGFDRVHQLTDDQQGGVAGVVVDVAQTLLRDVRTLGVQQLHVVAVVFHQAADESNDRKIPRMDSEYAMGYELTMELLQEGHKFTAIAGQNDMMAIGAIDALHEMRIHVPKDVSVIGCDNIFYSGIRRISLTTIDHFVALKGRDACDIIIRKIDMNDKFYLDERPASLYNIEYTPKLIKRRTTGYARLDRNQSDEQKNK